jgi:hypothetical protein
LVANSFDIDSDIIHAVFPNIDSNIIPTAIPNKIQLESLSSSYPPGLKVSHQASSRICLTTHSEPKHELNLSNASLTDNSIGINKKKDSGYDLEDVKCKPETEIIPQFYFPNGKPQDSTTMDFDWATIQVIDYIDKCRLKLPYYLMSLNTTWMEMIYLKKILYQSH